MAKKISRATTSFGVVDHIFCKFVVALAVDIDQGQLALDRTLDDVQERHRLAAAGGAEHQRVMLGILVGQMNRPAVFLIDAD